MTMMKRFSAVLLLALALVPVAASARMGSMPVTPASAQDGMEGMDEPVAKAAPVKKSSPVSTGGMQGMSVKPVPTQVSPKKIDMPAPSEPAQGMGAMLAPAVPPPMSGMSPSPAGTGMKMPAEPAKAAGTMEDMNPGSDPAGGRILWVFLLLNAGIIAAAALLKSKRMLGNSSFEVKP